QHLSKILAGLGVVLLATASLLAQAASPEPKYLYLNCNDDSSREVEAVIEYVNERFGALNRTSPLKVGVSVIYTPDTFYSPNLSSTPFREWGRDEDALRQRLIRHLEFARSREVPLLIQVDIERYVSPDLVNWHDPALPGYHAESNLKNVEWFGWPASSPANASGYAPRLTWRNWGKIIPVPPSPNLMSPVFRARAKALLEPLIEEVRKWEAALPAAQKYLFGGWRVGWETSLNNSELYHTGTNEAYASILAQPDSATNSAIIALLARPIQTLGYNGLRTAGLYKESDGSLTDTSGNLRPLAEEKMNQLLGMYLTEFSKLAVDRGLPRSKIYVHALRGLPALVINPYANPGITGTGRVGFALEGSDNTVTPGEPSVRTNDRAFSGAISQAMGTAQATGYSLGEIPFPNDISTPYTLLRSGQPVTYTYTEPAYERWKRFLDGNFRSIDSLRFASIYNFESVMNQLGAERAIMEFSARPPASPLLNSDFARPEGWRNGAGLNNWETVSSTPPVWRQVNPLSLNSVIRLGPERTLDPGFSQASTRTVASVQFTNIQQTFVDGFKTGDRFRLTFDWRQKAAGLTANARIFAVVAGRIDTANPIWSFSDTASVAPAAPAWRSLTEADPVGWSRPVPADTEALHIQLSNSSCDLPVFFSRVRLVRATADDLNQAPAFTGLVNRVLAPAAANTVTLHPIALNDDRTPLASLVLTARSNNERVVQATISYDATRRQAVLRLTRLAGATGLAGITVTATDADQKTATGWFLVEVTPNQPPLIGVIADQQTEPASTLTVPVNVSDPDLTDNAGLVVTAKVYRKDATRDPDWGNGDGRLLITGTGST
ncbi:hypothetical protein, partial [Flavobacterium sp.]|uniref:hypothetical protein n=1 Tax=Flavobacterium sp. TaxID=239 RepID=UPI0037BEFDAB